MNVPGFKIKRTIGRGGMATVYLAVQESLGREVVLKCMDSDREGERDFVGRFLNEGRNAAVADGGAVRVDIPAFNSLGDSRNGLTDNASIGADGAGVDASAKNYHPVGTVNFWIRY